MTSFVALFAAALFGGPRCFAAAQLASGAKTSAQPTSTNPSLRQIQITFDPAGNYSLTDFKLSVQYEEQYVTVHDVQFIDPFQQTGRITGNTDQGLVDISGHATGPVPADQDVNIFLIDFTLKDTATFDTPLTFKIFANGATGDFITGTNPDDPTDTKTTYAPSANNPDGVEPACVTVSFNEAAAMTPLPHTAQAGLALMGVLGAGMAVRKLRGGAAVG